MLQIESPEYVSIPFKRRAALEPAGSGAAGMFRCCRRPAEIADVLVHSSVFSTSSRITIVHDCVTQDFFLLPLSFEERSLKNYFDDNLDLEHGTKCM